MKTQAGISRRDLLKSGGALIVGFRFAGALPNLLAQESNPNPNVANPNLVKQLDPKEVDSFLAIHADGSLTVFTGKADIGTGLRIAISQIAAEELGIPIERVTLIDADTGLTPDQGGTGGSTGLTVGGVGVRQAAATARQGILKLASAQLNRPADDLVLADGQVRPKAGGQGIALAALVGDKKFSLQLDPKAPLKNPDDYTTVGKPVLRPDVPAKCTGKRTYVQDMKVPGMLHARIIRPASYGATLASVDEASIKAIPDVKVVRVQNFLAVVSKDEWAAIRAGRELKVTWNDWTGLPGSESLDRVARELELDRDDVIVNKGDTKAAMAGAVKKVNGSYFWPNQSHGSIGPSCSLADVRDSGTTVWSSSQGTHGIAGNISRILGIPREKIRVVYLDGSGSYGSNGNEDVAIEAAYLSKTVGAPVRVQWTRQDELGWDPKGPQQLLDIHAGLDAQGNIVAWETEMFVHAPRQGQRPIPSMEAAGLTKDRGQNSGLMTQNGDAPYAAANMRVVAHLAKETPLRPSNLRAPGKIANVFAVESMADQLAAAAGVDPIQFRLKKMTDPRAIEVVQKAAELFKWDTRPSPSPNPVQGKLRIGRGFAYMRYKQTENYVAIAMEVAVDPATGGVTVRRVTCGHDCGLIVNPDALRNQIEGCIIQTISRTIHEEVKFDRSRVSSVDWVSYPVLRFPEVPPIEIAMINHPHEPLLGAGEAPATPVGAAIANAIYDATGVRLQRVPFTPERVKAALSTATNPSSSAQ